MELREEKEEEVEVGSNLPSTPPLQPTDPPYILKAWENKNIDHIIARPYFPHIYVLIQF